MFFIGILAASAQAHHEQFIFIVPDSIRIANELIQCMHLFKEHVPFGANLTLEYQAHVALHIE